MKQKRPATESVARESAHIMPEQMAKLRELFPESVSEGKVDFEKLKETLGEHVDDRQERYSFTWAGKRDCIKLLQVPSRATLIPAPSESIDWNTTNNVFIDGENLEVLKLLYKAYYGRVKMIYIDPPYNTGKDFIYPDNYADPLDTYLRLTGQKDAEGNVLTSNPETSGRYHSAWLSMMYPRLFVGRQLLRDDGVIFVSIDDNEAHNLRAVMNEIFGEENFLALCTWRGMHTVRNSSRHFNQNTEFVLVFARCVDSLCGGDRTTWQRVPADKGGTYPYDERDGNGPYKLDPLHARNFYTPFEHRFRNGTAWRAPEGRYPAYSSSTLASMEEAGEIIFPGSLMTRRETGEKVGYSGREPMAKRFLERVLEGVPPDTLLPSEKVGFSQDGTKDLDELFGVKVFDQPKPVSLIRYLLSIASKRDRTALEPALILDFFAGSCTTADSVLRLTSDDLWQRQFVMVQLPEPLDADSTPRNSGFGTIADVGKERIRRVIAKMKKERAGKLATDAPQDFGFRVYKLAESNMKPWKGTDEKDPQKYAKTMEMFIDPLVPGWRSENVIAEVALKEAGYGLNYRVERTRHEGTKSTKKAEKEPVIYRVSNPDKEQFFFICLDDKVRLEDLRPLGLTRDTLFVCRDVALDDETAANLALQCRLKTI